ncbi:hypothetical protein CVT26_012890, partial [Gymnopilus dilepis]
PPIDNRSLPILETQERDQSEYKNDEEVLPVPLTESHGLLLASQTAYLSAYISAHQGLSSCNGAKLSLPTFKAHEREDKAYALSSAIDSAQEACKRQDNIFAAYAAIFGRSRTEAKPATSRSYHRFVNERLSQLSDIERKVDLLSAETEERLSRLTFPKERDDTFPLMPLTASVRRVCHDLSGVTSRSPSVQAAKSSIGDRLGKLIYTLQEAKKRWKEASAKLPRGPCSEVLPLTGVYKTGQYYLRLTNDIDSNISPKEHLHTPILSGVDPIIQASVFTMVVLQVILHLSRRGCHFLLAMMRYIVQLSLQRNNPILSVQDQKLLHDFPKDPDSAVKQFLLDGSETIYAVCPKATCHKLYTPNFSGSLPFPRYPEYCSHREFADGNECETRLTRPRVFGDFEVEVPIKRFVSFSFKEYVASLTCRSGFEDCMDSVSAGKGSEASEEMQDVFDGEFLRDFRGPDSKPFRSESGPEGRYSFSLGLDFFNPFTNKQGGKKASAGVISIVCLNLPMSLRYKPENMFLAGVIPGPSEPPLTAINHYLAPIVDEFLEFWRPGVRFSQTAKLPMGRLIFCALILAICDLPAARKLSGFASHTSEHFCNVCHCTLSNPGLQAINHGDWAIRTDSEYRVAAAEYKSGLSADSREKIFKDNGVRWSELLRLPYFDMVKCIAIDPAHNLFLGLINEHFTNILGIRLRPFQEKTVIDLDFRPTPLEFKECHRKDVEKVKKWLQAPYSTTFGPTQVHGTKKLMRLSLPVLQFVCEQIRCPLPILPENRTAPLKQEYCESILAWREEQVEHREAGAQSSTPCGHVLRADEMAEIWSDIEKLLTPTWMTSVPSKLGQPHHGKLKADQWRVLGTTHLTASLIRLWATGPMNDERSRRCYDILHVTQSLVSAVILATSHSMTKAIADAYLRHMSDYLEGIRRLFPDYQLVPNHHLALHIHQYLLLFGPVHSWWTFPFERLIGTLQRTPQNGRLGEAFSGFLRRYRSNILAGEVEGTMARAYGRRGKIATLLSKAGCPEVIQQSRPFFETLLSLQLRDDLRTTIRGDFHIQPECILDASSSAYRPIARILPTEFQFACTRAHIDVPSRGILPSRLTIGSLNYAISSKHPGNSCIMVSGIGSCDAVPAQLAYIVQFRSGVGNEKTCLGIRRYQEAGLAHDPYLAFPVLRARIWAARFHDLEIIEPLQVACHFASLPLILEGQELIIALPLSRTAYLIEDAASTGFEKEN